MKKIFTLVVLFAAFAFNAMADEKSYTDDLYVTINGETAGPMSSTINVAQQEDGNYTLSLKNFVLKSGDDVMPIGNITIPDVPVVEDNGSYKTLAKEANITIEAGDDPAYDTWMGPTICSIVGTIPVSINAKMSDEKIYAVINIDLTSSLGQSILVTLGTDDFPEGKNYTDDLYVTINEETAGPMESTINVKAQDNGNYTFTLKNFVMKSGEDNMAVGTIVIEDVEATTNEDGSISLAKEASVMIVEGDDPAYDTWLGPTICTIVGAIPVSLKGTMTDEKLIAEIAIDLSSSLGQAINVTFGADPTGINSINSETKSSDAIYSIGGQRLAQPQKGINIIGGKKVLY